LLRELKRLGVRNVVLSTNIELRGDGLPYGWVQIKNERDSYGAAYRAAAMKLHPDRGGKHEDFVKLQAAATILDKHHGATR
jgi:hypothetical protein